MASTNDGTTGRTGFAAHCGVPAWRGNRSILDPPPHGGTPTSTPHTFPSGAHTAIPLGCVSMPSLGPRTRRIRVACGLPALRFLLSRCVMRDELVVHDPEIGLMSVKTEIAARQGCGPGPRSVTAVPAAGSRRITVTGHLGIAADSRREMLQDSSRATLARMPSRKM